MLLILKNEYSKIQITSLCIMQKYELINYPVNEISFSSIPSWIWSASEDFSIAGDKCDCNVVVDAIRSFSFNILQIDPTKNTKIHLKRMQTNFKIYFHTIRVFIHCSYSFVIFMFSFSKLHGKTHTSDKQK